jgi:hypothetical protein
LPALIPISVADIKGIITHLKDRGIGVLITDHNVRDTLDICEKAYIVSAGTLIAEGTSERNSGQRNGASRYIWAISSASEYPPLDPIKARFLLGHPTPVCDTIVSMAGCPDPAQELVVSMKPTLQLQIGQHLAMTPQLQQAIRLLQLSTLELQQEVQEALDANPMLESRR